MSWVTSRAGARTFGGDDGARGEGVEGVVLVAVVEVSKGSDGSQYTVRSTNGLVRPYASLASTTGTFERGLSWRVSMRP
jgi:hypothetical protein